MEEMLTETLEGLDEDEELEEEADAEVDKVLFELTDGKLGQAGSVQTELPVSVHLNVVRLGSNHLVVSVVRRRRGRGVPQDKRTPQSPALRPMSSIVHLSSLEIIYIMSHRACLVTTNTTSSHSFACYYHVNSRPTESCGEMHSNLRTSLSHYPARD